MDHLPFVRVYATRGLYRPRSLGSLMDVNQRFSIFYSKRFNCATFFNMDR